MANVRQINVEAGLRCWTSGTVSAPLPPGLPNHAQGLVIARDGQDAVVEVGGRRWEVRWWNLDCGEEYETKTGEWIREPDLRVKAYLEKCLRKLERDSAESAIYFRKKYTRILRRNGWL